MGPRVLALVLLLPLLGCKNEQDFSAQIFRDVGTTVGDFDDVAEPLDRKLIQHTPYEGVIAGTTWDDDFEPSGMAANVEGLFHDVENLADHDVIFVASGTRGMGKRVYNGILADDQLVGDPAVVQNVRDYVERGGVLLFTDWTYDMVEAAWPEAITFVEEADGFDAAQKGVLGAVTARVAASELRQALEVDVLALDFNFSNWAVIQDVGRGTRVWLRGDVSYALADAGGFATVAGAPLLVSFEPPGARGKVVFSSFHLDAQRDAAVDAMLDQVIGTFANEASPDFGGGR